MASFKPPMVQCMKCHKQTNDPKVFACDHWFCRNCTLTCYNECVKTMRERGQEPPPRSFPCHVCHKMTSVPPGGPCMLPAPDTATVDKITKDLQRVSMSSGLQKSTDPVLSQPSTTVGVTQVTTCELLWEKNVSKGPDDIRIMSVDYLLDGAVCFIVAKIVDTPSYITTQSSEIVCLSLEGKSATMPFPCSFTQPESISVRHEDRTVAIHCFEGKYTVYIYTKTRGWTCSSYTVDTVLQDIALSSGGQLVGIQSVNDEYYQVIRFKSSGEKQWSVRIAPDSNSPPNVKVDKRDRVIISLFTEKRVSIYSPDGDLLINIPQVFVKEPAGICTDSQGNIYIADWSNDTIHQFSADGHFLQTVVKSKIYPSKLAMYGDCYLAVSSSSTGNVGLYKIN